MNKIEKKLKSLAEKEPSSNWKEKVSFRKENKAWLKKSVQISLRILDVLETKGWTQAQLAHELGVSPQQVSKYLHGENDFKLSTLAKIEDALGIELLQISEENVSQSIKIPE
ncbi:helix-turn-helix transcriptional regulator [Litoribacter ruber]|uniref:Helix-turn-helix transcriptional regulator n=1 Tax=Litoribacter ruber TaxID=702568 RepID=A0AAP2CIU9_9BACT|nr:MULTISPECIES: helix-turn-helix transcriptional regulator [Litoribacter]MBS9525541.1 helix-turn-helix transcriptional regulator [Litoribacter alkaliphilus]MBT0812790.1 helix-turn-helix transcriptional regulator [Litoribacter ruber]